MSRIIKTEIIAKCDDAQKRIFSYTNEDGKQISFSEYDMITYANSTKRYLFDEGTVLRLLTRRGNEVDVDTIIPSSVKERQIRCLRSVVFQKKRGFGYEYDKSLIYLIGKNIGDIVPPAPYFWSESAAVAYENSDIFKWLYVNYHEKSGAKGKFLDLQVITRNDKIIYGAYGYKPLYYPFHILAGCLRIGLDQDKNPVYQSEFNKGTYHSFNASYSISKVEKLPGLTLALYDNANY